MEVLTREKNNVHTIYISGEVDTTSAEKLKKSFEKIIALQPHKVILDFGELIFIGSSGIGKILSLYKALQVEKIPLQIINMNVNIFNLIKSFKLDEIIRMSTIEL